MLVVVVQHIPEWLKERYPWYIQTFNISNYALSALAAEEAFYFVSDGGRRATIASPDLGFFLAGPCRGGEPSSPPIISCSRWILRLARGHSFRESGLFTLQSVSTDLVIALLGVVVAALWLENPWLAALALAPLVLVHRTLALPKLEAEARQDPKTELFNARHFSGVLEEVLERAERTGRPVSLLVADLDLLREINNRYGHLAGDAVLVGIAAILREHLRGDDVAARFGGEEFAVLLPDHTRHGGRGGCRDVSAGRSVKSRFDVDTSSEPISATVSIGVASFPVHATTSRELIYRADVAAYRAKAQGRNRVVVASDEAELDELAAESARLGTGYRAGSSRSGCAAGDPGPPPPTPNYLSLSTRLRIAVGVVGVAGRSPPISHRARREGVKTSTGWWR